MLLKRRLLLKTIQACACLICVGLFFQSCGSKDQKNAEDKQAYIIPDSLQRTLVVDTVRQGELINSITLTGQVDFNQDKQVNIFPLVSGNVQDVKVQLGDYVHAGQPLATIKSSEMAGYSNNLVIAETNLTSAKKQLDATQDLFKSGLASQLDVTTAQVNYDQAVSQLEMAKRVLKINGNNTQGDYEVKSPINGFIVQKMITNNQAIRTDNGSALFTVSDLKNVWVWANVYESNLEKVRIGDHVDVSTLSYPNRVFKGTIDKIMHVLDPSSKVTKVRIVIDNSDYALRPQMFASVTVTNTQHEQALYIPSSALIFDHSQYYVLVYGGKGKASIAQVQKINSLGDKVYLKQGVRAGDQVIVTRALQIYDQLNN